MFDYENMTPEEIANLTDEEFSKLDPSKLPTFSEPTEDTQPEVTVEDTPEVAETPTDTPQPAAEEVASEGTANGEPSVVEDTQAADTVTKPTDEVKAEVKPTEKTQEPSAEVNPEKAFFDAVTSEFNANGKSYKIDNAEDVKKLMQMGLNYHQKMAAMKPNLKIVRALQDAGITSVEQLGHLLDLHAKKPEAIAKLVQDSGLDTYEFEEQAKNYVPSTPNVNDQTIEFEMVAQELESNPSFGTVVQQLHNFDTQTKQTIFENPNILRTLTDHVSHGFYDKIMAQLEIANALGHTRGMSFLQAYEAIGQQMFGQQQAPNQVQQPMVTPQVIPQPVPVPVASKPNPVNNTARQAAASVTNTASTTHKPMPTPKEIWEMSDEEFAKLDPKFLK